MLGVLVPSRDVAPRDSANAKGAPQVPSGAAAPDHRRSALRRIPVGSSRGVIVPSGHDACLTASSIGNLLYLVSVGLVAAGTVAIFFGTGLSLLAPPAGGMPPRSTVKPALEAIALQPSPRNDDQARSAGAMDPVQSPAALPSPAVGPAMPRDDALPSKARVETLVPPASENRPAAAAATAPDAAATTAPVQPTSALAAAEARELLQHGDSVLRTGDVASARLFYERASAAGDGWAALRLGATFDPTFLERLGLGKLQSDAVAARAWYSRALELGVIEAKRQLNGLEARQGR